MFIILRHINLYVDQTMLPQHDQNKNVNETKQLRRSQFTCFYMVRFKMTMMKRLLSSLGHTSMVFIVAKRVKQE